MWKTIKEWFKRNVLNERMFHAICLAIMVLSGAMILFKIGQYREFWGGAVSMILFFAGIVMASSLHVSEPVPSMGMLSSQRNRILIVFAMFIAVGYILVDVTSTAGSLIRWCIGLSVPVYGWLVWSLLVHLFKKNDDEKLEDDGADQEVSASTPEKSEKGKERQAARTTMHPSGFPMDDFVPPSGRDPFKSFKDESLRDPSSLSEGAEPCSGSIPGSGQEGENAEGCFGALPPDKPK